ncbi:MAG: thioredoxin-disulfide reductase, partial [Synergistaceae bacterium]|nr:thioredoxin-disulfide reductase [Synergistaceae bacterium]
ETFAKSKGIKVPVIDGYRNARMTEKLGLTGKLPVIAKIQKGVVAETVEIKSEADIEKALA